MAKRRNQLAEKLGSAGAAQPESQPGWRDAIMLGAQETREEAPPQPKPRPRRSPARAKPKRKTYYLPPPLIERIELLAGEERVGISELVTFLLTTAVDQVESGRLEIPTAPAKRRIAP